MDDNVSDVQDQAVNEQLVLETMCAENALEANVTFVDATVK